MIPASSVQYLMPTTPFLRLLAVWLLLCLAGCASLPEMAHDRPLTQAIDGTQDTPLGRAVAALPGADPQRTAVLPIDDGREAYVVRAVLADAATRSLDLQYYIWNDDLTGRLMLQHLWRAAERGVRVRLLLDDNNTSGLDELLAAVNRHPNIELRLFNPFAHRGFRALDFLTDFELANRRMHNKAFIADGQLAVLGGRNVGDEYFGAGNTMSFADLDVLLAGKIVPEVEASFDDYWNHGLAYDADTLLRPAGPDAEAMLQRSFDALDKNPRTQNYLGAVRESALMRQMKAGELPFEWTTARLVADKPDKVLGREPRETIAEHVRRAVGAPTRSLDLVSPYFVPTRGGTDALIGLRKNGVRARVLTNSLAATDVMAVHAGYERWRGELLRAGVQLFELKPQDALPSPKAVHLAEGIVELGGEGGSGGPGGSTGRGSSSASLHAKTFGVDGQRIYVGSFNLDPRSAHLNTELGVAIESSQLAGKLATAFETVIPQRAYELQLRDNQLRIRWIDRGPDGETVYTTEPQTTFWRRLGVRLLSLLPIDGLL